MMNFASIGSLSNHIKSMKLQNNWNLRRDNPRLKKGNDAFKSGPLGLGGVVMEKEDIRRQMESIKRANNISSLQGKLKSGQNLTPEEMDYLKKNSPEDYEEAVKIERERKEYESELKNCRTKEDVRELQQRKLSQFVTQARAISSNPNIPKAEKLKRMEYLAMHMAGVMSEHQSFVQGAEYAALPEIDDKEKTERRVDRSEALDENNQLPELEARDYEAEFAEILDRAGSPGEAGKSGGEADDASLEPSIEAGPGTRVYNGAGKFSPANTAPAEAKVSIEVKA